MINQATPPHSPKEHFRISSFTCPFTYPVFHPHPFGNPEEPLTSQQRGWLEVDAHRQRCFPSDLPGDLGADCFVQRAGAFTSVVSYSTFWVLGEQDLGPAGARSTPTGFLQTMALTCGLSGPHPEPGTSRRGPSWSCGSEQGTVEVPSRARRSPGSALIFMS